MHRRIAAGFIALICLAASGARAQQGQSTQQPDMGAFMGALGAMMQGNTNTAAAAGVVDFRELKALLPAELPGMKRTAASGEKTTTMGMTLAFAEGRYEGTQNEYITIKITDMGGSSLASMMHAGWAMTEIDRETETGYERTTTLQGNKAMEKYDSRGQDGSIQVLVASRFMVETDGSKIPAEALKTAIEKVDLAKLAALKK